MKFLSSKKLAIFFLALAVGIFALIFYLFDLPFEGFFLGAGLLCFISLIGLFISFIYFEKDKTREEIIKDLKEEIQENVKINLNNRYLLILAFSVIFIILLIIFSK